MLAYRVYVHLDGAAYGDPGHWSYLHRPQGASRFDNPSAYDLWYLGRTPEVAVAETFGRHAQWRESMFEMPVLPGSRRTLGVFEVPDDLSILDLDDAQNLLDRGLRPTQVISRNRSASQAIALRAFDERKHDGSRCWGGLQWWSYYRPEWTVLGLWVAPGDPLPIKLVRRESLDLDHIAIVSTARSLVREIVR